MRIRLPSRRTRPLAYALITLVLAVLGWQLHGSDRGVKVWEAFHTETLSLMLAPHDPALRFAIGNYYFGGGAYDLARAERAYRDALALDHNFPGAHYQLARVYFIESKFPAALAEVNEELAGDPSYARSYYVRGLIYGYTGNFSGAESDFRAFLTAKPDSWAGNNDLAWIYFQEGKYKEAGAAARAGLAYSPGNPWLLNSLGVALLNTGDSAGAKTAFTAALKAVDAFSPGTWGAAYPGNDPGLYGEGLDRMRISIQKNLELLK